MHPTSVMALAPADRARAGARFLDERLPGWAARITRPICVASPLDCPLGQLGGNFTRGLDLVGLWFADPASTYGLGFLIGTPADTVALDAAWEVEVFRRRLADRLAAFQADEQTTADPTSRELERELVAV